MLILTRSIQQKIVINGNIIVTVLLVRNGHVRIGVEAPKDVPVHRQEIWEKIMQQNEHVSPFETND